MALPWSDQRERSKYLPTAEQVRRDAQRVRSLIRLLCADKLSPEDVGALREHWDMPRGVPIALPRPGSDLVAQITQQVVDVLKPGVLGDMLSGDGIESVRSTRNTMRVIFLLAQASDVDVPGVKRAHAALLETPANHIATEAGFLKEIATDLEIDVVKVAHVLKLGLLGLIRISNTHNYLPVQRLREEFAIMGIEIDLAGSDVIRGEDLKANQVRGQYGTIYEDQLELARVFLGRDGQASPLDASIIQKLASHHITQLGQLTGVTYKELTRFSLSQPERARVISVLALEGTVLKDALPHPFHLTGK